MKNILFFCLCLSGLLFSQETHKVHIPDGQVKNRAFKVFVKDADISLDMSPKIEFIRNPKSDNYYEKEAFEAAGNQTITIKTTAGLQTWTGSLLLFDFSDVDISLFNPSLKGLIKISWTVKGDAVNVMPEKHIYLGHPIAAFLWATVIILIFLALFNFCMEDNKNEPLGQKLLSVVSTANKNLSLSLVQLALWTLVIGYSFTVIALLTAHIPDIPDSLIILMGLSVTTATVGHYQSKRFVREKLKGHKDSPEENENANHLKVNLSSILSIEMAGPKNQRRRVFSLGKAQNLYWTLIAIIIFIIKSIQEAQLWDVPNELVALMGISQAGFLSRKQSEISEQEKIKNQKES